MNVVGLAMTGKSAFLMRQDAREMPENEKAGVYAPAFLSGRSPLEKMSLVRRWEDDAEAGKEGCRSGCSLLEKVFQRFALQSVQPDIFLVIITKGLWSKKQDIKIFW